MALDFIVLKFGITEYFIYLCNIRLIQLIIQQTFYKMKQIKTISENKTKNEIEEINNLVAGIILSYDDKFDNIDSVYQDNKLVFYLKNIKDKNWINSCCIVNDIKNLNNPNIDVEYYPLLGNVIVTIKQDQKQNQYRKFPKLDLIILFIFQTNFKPLERVKMSLRIRYREKE